jgi:lipoprotein-releasing system permease protein
VVIVTLRTMQDLYGLGRGVHGINVKIAPARIPTSWRADQRGAGGDPATSRRARGSRPTRTFLFVLQLEKNMIFFLLTFIIVVAAFSVTSSLLIAVVRKTREIGLLGALGGKPRQVAACFCFQGFSSAWSAPRWPGLGFTMLHFRNDMIRVFTQLTGSEEVLTRFYQFSRLPAYTAPGRSSVMIIVCTIVISTLAGLLPAWRAARLKPVEALRRVSRSCRVAAAAGRRPTSAATAGSQVLCGVDLAGRGSG